MKIKTFITGIGLCKEPSANRETIKPVKTVIKAEELALAATSMALKQSGLNALENCGIVFGIDNAIEGCKADFFKGLLHDGPIGASPLLFPYTSPNAITAQATIAFGIKGEDITTTGGPLSFLKAADYGLELLNSGLIQSVVVGGVSENEAMAMILERLSQGDSKIKSALGKITRYEAPLPLETDASATIIDSIEDSFMLMDNAIKTKKAIKASDKQGNNISLMIES